MIGWVTFRMSQRLSDRPYVDFEAFYDAACAFARGENIYAVGMRMYIYPPLFAFFLSPLAQLSMIPAAWVWYGASLLGTLTLLRLSHRAIGLRLGLPTDTLDFLPVLALTLVVWVNQFRWEFEQGQADWLLLLGFVLALSQLDERPWLSGLSLGMAINIKYTPMIALVYLILRGRMAAAAWTFIGCVVWAFVPALAIGWTKNLELLKIGLSGLLKLVGIESPGQPGMVFPLTYKHSISIPSGAARISEQLGTGLGMVALLTAAVAGGVLVLAAWQYRRNGSRMFVGRFGSRELSPPNRGWVAVEWLGLVVAALCFSPQTQNRHCFIALPVVMLGIQLAIHCPGAIRRSAVLALAVGLLGLTLPPGSPTFRDAVDGWRFISGGSISLLAMYLVLLGATLRHLSENEMARSDRPLEKQSPIAA